MSDVQSRTRGHILSTYVNSDHDPLYRFHQWKRNPRILNVKEIKSVPLYSAINHAERFQPVFVGDDLPVFFGPVTTGEWR